MKILRVGTEAHTEYFKFSSPSLPQFQQGLRGFRQWIHVLW
jgi:hypothetical protein